jgi:hypothetical protein
MADRDLIGYGPNPPHPRWPDEARIAVQFVLNIEEGAESSIVNGDHQSEAYLHELPGRPARSGERDLSVESMYEYGARAGVWRLLDMFNARGVPLTAFAVGQALELCVMADTRSPVTATAGSTIAMFPKRSSGTISAAPSRSSSGSAAAVRWAGTPAG